MQTPVIKPYWIQSSGDEFTDQNFVDSLTLPLSEIEGELLEISNSMDGDADSERHGAQLCTLSCRLNDIRQFIEIWHKQKQAENTSNKGRKSGPTSVA